MPYTDRFNATDDLITHLITIIPGITDSELKSNYAGFLSVSAVTVYELAIKDIFNEFAHKKNRVFGNFVENYFNRINGKIMISALTGEHIKRFGSKYQKKFNGILEEKEKNLFRTDRISVKTYYGNLVICRHKYVHSGNPTLSIDEVIEYYNYGKEIIHCLYNSMQR